jgi:hypothetical protein
MYKISALPVQLFAFDIVHNSISTFCRGYPYSPATRLVACFHLGCYTTARLLPVLGSYTTSFGYPYSPATRLVARISSRLLISILLIVLSAYYLLCVRASDYFLRCCLPQTWISTIHTAASVQQVLESLFCWAFSLVLSGLAR